MRRAKPTELRKETFPVLTAVVSEKQLKALFPVDLAEIDRWAEPEPSVGALLQLRSGPYFVVVYGKETQTLKLLLPEGTDPSTGLEEVLAEAPIPERAILWRHDESPQPERSASQKLAPELAPGPPM